MEKNDDTRRGEQSGGTTAATEVCGTQEAVPRSQRQYKDRLFCMIFREKKELLSLYNAVNETDYDDPDALEINTLENAIYMNMKNDISFVLQMELNLYEHQSTFNPNIPLRDLFYIARELERLTVRRSLYSSTLVELPTPRFVVFYNGTSEQPERRTLRLSDAYIKHVDEPELELKVLMLNINHGKNRELMEKCQSLREYMFYVAKVREYTAEAGIEAAVDRAVAECISEGILRDFLLKNKAEAIQMSIFEYDEERERELLKKAYLEEGEARGRRKGEEIGEVRGRQKGEEIGEARGRQKGEEIGEARGRRKGEEIGEVRGKAESVLTLLSDLGEVPEDLRECICAQRDSKVLQRWLRLAARSDDLEEFRRLFLANEL